MFQVGQSITATASAAPDVAQMYAWSRLVSAPGGPQTSLSTTKTQAYSVGPPVVPALYTATFTPNLPGTWVVRFADSLTPPTTGAYVQEFEFIVFPLDY